MPQTRQLTTSVRSIHLNRLATAIVVVSLAVGAVGLYFFQGYRQRQAKRQVMTVARELRDAGDFQMVVRHLNQFLLAEPMDVDALTLKAEVVAELAKTPDSILGAAKAQETLLRADPDPNSKASQDARRRLVSLYIRYGDIKRSFARTFIGHLDATLNMRYGAAEKIATELIERGADDPEAHRLRALAGSLRGPWRSRGDRFGNP